jgi:hypothetical protein
LELFNFDIKFPDGKIRFCEPYILDKQYIIFNHASQTRAKARLERIYIDIAGGGAILSSAIVKIMEENEFDYKNANQFSLRNAYYFMIIIDDYSRYR